MNSVNNRKSYVTKCNTFLNVGDEGPIIKWIEESQLGAGVQSAICKIGIKPITAQTVIGFQNQLNEASKYFPKNFDKKIKAVDLTLDVYQYFINFIENFVDLIKINSADNENLISRWNKFRCDFAYMRYDSDPHLYDCVNEFISYLNEQSEKINQSKEQKIYSQTLWDVWARILKTPDILDVPLANLSAKTSLVFVTTKKAVKVLTTPVNIKLIQESCSLMIDALSKDVPWVFEEVEALLKSNSQFPFHPIFNNPEAHLKRLEEFKKTFTPKIPFISLKNLNDLHETKNQINYLYDEIKLQGNTFTECVNNGYFDNHSVLIFNLKLIEYFVDKDSDGDSIIDIDSYFKRNLEHGFYLESLEDFKIGRMSASEFKNYIAVLETKQKCHVLIDTYIAKKLVRLKHSIDGLRFWHQTQSENKTLDECLAITSQQNLSFLNVNASDLDGLTKVDTRNIDDLMAEFATLAPKKNTKKSKVRKQIPTPKKEQLAQLVKKEVLCNNDQPTLNRPLIQSKPFKQPRSVQIALKIKNLIRGYQSSEFGVPCGALNQSLMHLSDLSVVYKRLQGIGLKESPALNAVQVIASAYYHMEQLIRFQRIMSNKPYDPNFLCHEHNLKMLLKPLTGFTGNTVAPHLLYLGNFWSFHTYEQLDGWSHLENVSDQKTPEPLRTLLTAVENPESHQIIPNLKKYVDSTLLFSEAFLKNLGQGIPQDQWEMEEETFFKHQYQFDTKSVQSVAEVCEKSIKTLELHNKHPAILKLKQAHQNLKILQEILALLNKLTLAPDTFSQLVRGAVYFQNGVLENLLQAIYFLKTGINSQDHNLVNLYKMIFQNSEDEEYLSTEWGNANNFCRYPFEYQKPCSPTHALILEAELLRERPEFDQGFKMRGTNVEVNSSGVLEKLKQLLESAALLMQNRLIQGLNQEIKKI